LDKKNDAKNDTKAIFEKGLETIKELAKVPRCKLNFRDGKAFIVCETKTDQKIAYEMVVEGIVIEVKPEKVVKAE